MWRAGRCQINRKVDLVPVETRVAKGRGNVKGDHASSASKRKAEIKAWRQTGCKGKGSSAG